MIDIATAHNINTDFFNEHNESSCYLLGYLYADGSIYKKGNRNELTISGTDEVLLETILGLLEGTQRVVSTKTSYRVRISSKDLVNKLMELGLGPNKAETLIYPTFIPRDMERHFIRGYFDGKGSFLLEEDRRIIINFSSGSGEFLEGLRDSLVSYGLARAELHKSGAGLSTNHIRYYVNDTRKLVGIMYTDARIYSGDKRTKYNRGV